VRVHCDGCDRSYDPDGPASPLTFCPVGCGNCLDHCSCSMRELVEDAQSRGELLEGAWDYALPVAWTLDVEAKCGEYPYGFVWYYHGKSIFGEPYPVTQKARVLLARYKEALDVR